MGEEYFHGAIGIRLFKIG